MAPLMYNGTLTLIIRESGAKCFASLQVTFCNTAPYRIKDFPISHSNEVWKEWIRSARRRRIVDVPSELWSLLSCACAAAGAGTWLMSTWHWFEYFLEWGTTEWVIWKHIKSGQSPCVKNALHINSNDMFLLYSRTDRQDLGVLTFKTLKASLWPRKESKCSRIFWKKNN